MDIHTVPMGITRCYVIRDTESILVDCGPPNKLNAFVKGLQKASIDPKHIKLIVQTHGHWDHIGSARVVKSLTGALLAMHEPDSSYLEKSMNLLPIGVTLWGKILTTIPTKPKVGVTAVDIILSDEDFSLVPFGIRGKVVYTPGHTMGSVSVLLDNGDAFVGDLVMSGFPVRVNPGLPIFAEDTKRVKESIKLLLESGAKTFYPGHGRPFPASAISKFLS